MCDRRQESTSGRCKSDCSASALLLPRDEPTCSQRCNGRNKKLGKTQLLRTW